MGEAEVNEAKWGALLQRLQVLRDFTGIIVKVSDTGNGLELHLSPDELHRRYVAMFFENGNAHFRAHDCAASVSTVVRNWDYVIEALQRTVLSRLAHALEMDTVLDLLQIAHTAEQQKEQQRLDEAISEDPVAFVTYLKERLQPFLDSGDLELCPTNNADNLLVVAFNDKSLVATFGKDGAHVQGPKDNDELTMSNAEAAKLLTDSIRQRLEGEFLSTLKGNSA